MKEFKKVLVDPESIRWDKSQGLILQLEKLTKTQFLCIYLSLDVSLTDEEVPVIAKHIDSLDEAKKISVVVYGPGGSGKVATVLANILRNKFKNIDIYIPQIAASALTMFSLVGDQIFMGPSARLSPIDTSIVHPLAPKNKDGNPVSVEIEQIKKYLEFTELAQSKLTSKDGDFKKTAIGLLSEHIHPIVLGTVQRILSLSIMLTSDILALHLSDKEQINKIASTLNGGFPAHSYPITLKKAQEIGINAKQMPKEIAQITNKIINLFESFAEESSLETQGLKTSEYQDITIESSGFRSAYKKVRKQILNAGKWESTATSGSYKHYVFLSTEKTKGVYETALANIEE